MANGWTLERRIKQSLLIKAWQPWRSSTGPRTAKGKKISSLNAFKGGIRKENQQISGLLKEQERVLSNLYETIIGDRQCQN